MSHFYFPFLGETSPQRRSEGKTTEKSTMSMVKSPETCSRKATKPSSSELKHRNYRAQFNSFMKLHWVLSNADRRSSEWCFWSEIWRLPCRIQKFEMLNLFEQVKWPLTWKWPTVSELCWEVSRGNFRRAPPGEENWTGQMVHKNTHKEDVPCLLCLIKYVLFLQILVLMPIVPHALGHRFSFPGALTH
jgi:hypothetical protein